MRIPFLRGIITTVFLGAFAGQLSAQQKWTRYRAPEFAERPGWSVGVNFGQTDLWGDIGTKSPLNHYLNEKYFDKPCFMGGVFTRYAFHPGFVMRIGVNYGSVYANDNFNYNLATGKGLLGLLDFKVDNDAYIRYRRNLDVKTNIWEGTLLLEINPFRLGNLEKKIAKKRMQPYLLIGGGGFHFRPKGTYTPRGTDGNPNGKSRQVDLYDLNLEGNGVVLSDSLAAALQFTRPAAYSLWQAEIPFGLGMRWDIGKQLSLGVELLFRYTFTDYLDDVSGFYVDKRLFDYIHKESPKYAAMAKDMYDKSWLIDLNATHSPTEMRGISSAPDAYSSLRLSFFYRLKTKKIPWWYQENW